LKQALKIYQRAINLAGSDYRPYYLAGQVLKDSKEYLAAEAMLRKAAQLAPNEVSVHRLLGAVVALNLVHNRRLVPTEVQGS
jgi:tetratricopeptide (TPR) repeat protein